MNTAKKGSRYENEILRDFIAIDPEHRTALRGAGSKARGRYHIDLVLIDHAERQIRLVQCKNSKDWNDRRKDESGRALNEQVGGAYFVIGQFM